MLNKKIDSTGVSNNEKKCDNVHQLMAHSRKFHLLFLALDRGYIGVVQTSGHGSYRKEKKGIVAHG
jgi:hypothetical protein